MDRFCTLILITHLCFADDLFLFTKGNADSVRITMEELAKFEAFSGMQVNKQKSAVFLAAIDDSVRDAILDMTGFRLGSLPMKYLGCRLYSPSYLTLIASLFLIRLQPGSSRGLVFLCPLWVGFSLYLLFSIAFKHSGALCSSSPS